VGETVGGWHAPAPGLNLALFEMAMARLERELDSSDESTAAETHEGRKDRYLLYLDLTGELASSTDHNGIEERYLLFRSLLNLLQDLQARDKDLYDAIQGKIQGN
jgi:hypothetical protein